MKNKILTVLYLTFLVVGLLMAAYNTGYYNATIKMQEEAIKYGHGYIECSVDGTVKFFVWKFDVPEPTYIPPEFPNTQTDDELMVLK